MPKKKLGAAGNVYQQQGREGFVIRWIDSTGRRRSRSLTTARLKEARQILASEKANVEKAKILGAPLPSDETFADWATEFLRLQEKRITSHVVRGKLSRAEFVRQQGIVETWLKPYFGTMKLARIRKADVVGYSRAHGPGIRWHGHQRGQRAEAHVSSRLRYHGWRMAK